MKELNDVTKRFIGNMSAIDLLQSSVRKDVSNVVSLIVPHAGYFFSGKVAASGYNQLDDDYDNVFLIATSHKTNFRGASVFLDDSYYGIEINKKISNELISKNDLFINDNDIFTNDHNLEIHLPFIKEKLKRAKLISIMVGETDYNNLRSMSDTLKDYFGGRNLFVISSDFSHYPPPGDAVKIDFNTAKIIMDMNTEKYVNYISEKLDIKGLVTKLCGWSSVYILLKIMEGIGDVKSKIIMYRNSSYVSDQEVDSVVGYFSIVFYKDSNSRKEEVENVDIESESDDKEFYLSYGDKADLIDISRKTVDKIVTTGEKYDIDDTSKFSHKLKENLGSFVTIKNKGHLRGCIGVFSPGYPLYEVVRNMAVQSATSDGRFNPITVDELGDIDIEVSVLTPFKKIDSIDEIVLGTHGIYIEKDGRTATYLPQVATETGWDIYEFLGNCSLKAGLGKEDWKDATIYTYRAIVFNEKDVYKEAMYYDRLDDNKVKCNLCPHYCVLSVGQMGICRARKNIEGRLYSLGYNNPSVIGAVDPIEKKPLKHFYPGKFIYSLSCNGCNFHCDNCQNSGISQNPKFDISGYNPRFVIKDCLDKNLDMIAFTYTEPTIYYEYMLDIAKLAKDKGILTVMVSNGYINREPLLELLPYIDAANIDLKFFNDKTHRKITKGKLQPVLDTIRAIFDSGVHIEITNLIIEGLNDDEKEVSDMYQWIVDNGMEEVPIHLIRFFPSYKMMDRKSTSAESTDKVKSIALSKGIKTVYP